MTLVLQINPYIDCAGVSYNLCSALNKHTKIQCRHIVGKEHPFGYPFDIGEKNFNQTEFEQLVKDADILHFNHMDYFSHAFGIDWTKYLKKKIVVYHSHAGWEEGKEYHEFYKWNLLYHRFDDADAVLVCSPANVNIFKGAKWIPNVLPEYGIESERNFEGILKVCQCPSSWKYKNVEEMRTLMGKTLPDIEFHLIEGLHKRVLELMSKNHLLFDNIRQGYFGQVSLEAMGMGVVPIAYVRKDWEKMYCDVLGCESIPVEHIYSMQQVKDKIMIYYNNRNLLKEKSKEVKRWIQTYYSERRIVKMWEEFYNGLL